LATSAADTRRSPRTYPRQPRPSQQPKRSAVDMRGIVLMLFTYAAMVAPNASCVQ